jgi:hypothetical protein
LQALRPAFDKPHQFGLVKLNDRLSSTFPVRGMRPGEIELIFLKEITMPECPICGE